MRRMAEDELRSKLRRTRYTHGLADRTRVILGELGSMVVVSQPKATATLTALPLSPRPALRVSRTSIARRARDSVFRHPHRDVEGLRALHRDGCGRRRSTQG